jgi:hypothetical protein
VVEKLIAECDLRRPDLALKLSIVEKS